MKSVATKEAALLSTSAVAALLKVHPGTVVNWRSWSTGPAYVRQGRRILYKPSAVRAWKRSRETVSVAG